MLDVALNPAVLQDNEEDKTEVYMLALSFVQQQHGMRVSQQYTVVSCSPKSSPDDLYRRLGFQQRPNTSKQPDTGRVISLIPRQAATCPLCWSYFLLLLWVYHLSPSTTVSSNLQCSFLQTVRPQPPSCSRSPLYAQRNKTRTQPKLSVDLRSTKRRI